MTSEIASLGLKVETDSVQQAREELDRLVQSGASAEKAAQGVEKSWSGAGQKVGSAAAPMASTGSAVKLAREEVEKQRRELAQLVGQIDPVVGALNRLDEQQEKLRAYRRSGLLDAETFTQYNTKLEEARRQLTGTNQDLQRTGNTAKQTAFALRQLPAQFSDIVISLQAGQNPLQVFLQQGSQIKDSFGGVGPALRETARYALGLVNPFTLGAAAVAALVYGYNAGSKEAQAFNAALITTGNYAGTTAGNLAAMAAEISKVKGTQGQASAALVEFARAGVFGADQLQKMAGAAVAWESATGQAVSETVAQFKRLQAEPAVASAKLNEQYNYLTASVYAQIAALVEQGKESEAAKLATETYADVMSQRAKDIEGNLNVIGEAWKYVTEQSQKAIDAIKDIGREAPLEEQISRLEARIKQMSIGIGVGIFQDRDEAINRARELLDMLKSERDAKEEIAKLDAESARVNQEGIKGQNLIAAAYKASLSQAERYRKELKELDKAYASVQSAGSATAENEKKYQQARLDLLGKIKDAEEAADRKANPRQRAYQDDSATKMLLNLREQEAALQAQLGTTQKLTAEQKKRAEFDALIAELKGKDILTAEQKSLLANQDAIRAQLDKNVAVAEELRLRGEAVKVATYQATLDARLAQDRQGFAAQLVGVGRGDQARQRMQEELRIQQDYERQQRRLQEQLNREEISQSTYDQQTAAIGRALDERLAMQQDYYRQLDEAQSDWAAGARAGFETYLESAGNMAAQSKSLVMGAFQSMEDAVAQFAMTGKLSFADFAKSVIADMARIAARQAAVGIFASIAGSAFGSFFGGGMSASASGSLAAGASQSGYASDLSNFVAGARASGGPVAPNSLYQVNELGPELLNQNGRTYLMTGAGGGSITPLGQGGAMAAGGGAAPQINITISRDGNGTVEGDTAMAQEMGPKILDLVRTEIAKNERKTLAPGGNTWRAMNQR